MFDDSNKSISAWIEVSHDILCYVYMQCILQRDVNFYITILWWDDVHKNEWHGRLYIFSRVAVIRIEKKKKGKLAEWNRRVYLR